LQEAPYAFLSTYASAIERSLESWSSQADSTALGADRSTFFAFSVDTPVGIAAVYRLIKEPGTGELLQVWVDPEYRNIGVASRLMDAAFQWAGAHGFRRVIATVTKGNTSALNFYRKRGFILAEGSSFEGPDDTVLVKELSAE